MISYGFATTDAPIDFLEAPASAPTVEELQKRINDLSEILSHQAMLLSMNAPIIERQDVLTLRDALAELVALKDIKEKNGATPDYLARRGLAWDAARAAVAATADYERYRAEDDE